MQRLGMKVDFITGWYTIKYYTNELNEPAMCNKLPTLWATLWECGGGGGLSKLLTLPSFKPPPPMMFVYPIAMNLY